jgi:hypothetical protein
MAKSVPYITHPERRLTTSALGSVGIEQVVVRVNGTTTCG